MPPFLVVMLIKKKKKFEPGMRWLMPIILATQEVEIRGSRFEASPGKIFLRPYLKKNLSQKRAGGVHQGVGPEFKP
jgi:hypothetical protein